jgi:hypothetical protein
MTFALVALTAQTTFKAVSVPHNAISVAKTLGRASHTPGTTHTAARATTRESEHRERG